MNCLFTSEWDDGSVVTTPCVYNDTTGQTEPEISKGPIPTGMVLNEYITLEDGKELKVCPECHEYVLTTEETCSNPGCDGCDSCSV